MEGALHHARKVLGARDAKHALADRATHLDLVAVGVQVDFLMRAAAEMIGCTLPVMTTSGMESSAAVAIPVTALVRPGPTCVSTTPGFPETRA